ncbi:hypothetical protein TNCV_1512571 [Trichonephila clavipes]|nr:hypothetical protein TNCV_1512571 [Trichonephila clavipes]
MPEQEQDIGEVESSDTIQYDVVTNATCLTKSDRGPLNSSQLRTRIFTPAVLALALSTMQVTVRFCSVPPQSSGRKPWTCQGTSHLSSPSTNHTRGLAARRLFRVFMPQKHYTFINIHVFSGIRTQSLRYQRKKQDMLQLAEELGINATLNMTVPSIKIAITNSEGYEEEFVKNLYETIIANGKRLEELERAEK